MSIRALFFYLVASGCLNGILGEVEKRKRDNFWDYVVVVLVFIILLAGWFQKLGIGVENVFLVVLFQVIEIVIYQLVVCEKKKVDSYNLKKYIVSLVGTYLLNISFINEVDSVFLEGDQLKLLVWGGILVFVYYWGKERELGKRKHNYLYYLDREYVVVEYTRFKMRYGQFIRLRDRELVWLVYAIMIYENYQRPEKLRQLDGWLYKYFKQRGKFGIMQVKRNYLLTDEESIRLAVGKLRYIWKKRGYRQGGVGQQEIRGVIRSYYHKEVEEIWQIYLRIRESEGKRWENKKYRVVGETAEKVYKDYCKWLQ